MIGCLDCVKRSLLFVNIVLLSGCGLVTATSMQLRGPKDLRFASLAIIDLRDLTDKQRRYVRAQDKNFNKILKLQFTSDTTDLHQYAVDNGSPLSEFSLCNEQGEFVNDHGIAASIYILHEWVAVSQSSAAREHANALANKGSDALVYDAYFNIKSMRPVNPEPILNPSPSHFDLAAYPHDVCFQIIGGDGWTAYGYSSNTIIISKEQIAEALRSEK